MTKYKRFVQTCTREEDFQNFYDMLTKEGWEIIFYEEKSHGQWGDAEMYVHAIALCKKSEKQTL